MKRLYRFICLIIITVLLASSVVSCKKKEEDFVEEVAGAPIEDATSDTNNEKSEDGEKDDNQTGKDAKLDDEKSEQTPAKESEKEERADKEDTDKQPEMESAPEDNPEEEETNKTDAPENNAEVDDEPKQDEQRQIPLTRCPFLDEDITVSHNLICDINFLPDEPDEIAKSADRATKKSLFTLEFNPIINDDGKANEETMPSMSIDDTAFVRSGVKLSNLKGKTLTFFTADDKPLWSFHHANGKLVDEWGWFDSLKSELGLSVKYTVKQGKASLEAARKSIVSGKSCDIICTNSYLSVQSFTISRSITPLININDNGSSPGVCQRTMDICKWGNSYRVIAPVGVVDVLWYNQTLSDKLSLTDPHKTWKNGGWNYSAFESYLASVTDGKTQAFTQNISDTMFSWFATNGNLNGKDVNCVYLYQADDGRPWTIVNWNEPITTDVLKYITSFNGKFKFENKDYSGLFDGSILMTPTIYTQKFHTIKNSEKIKLNWVPYPKSQSETGTLRCRTSGRGMMLPYKTSSEANVSIALKFMELWATRYTESYFDNLAYYGMNYADRKEYFDFVSKNAVFAPEYCGELFKSELVGGDFYKAIEGVDYNYLKEQLRIVSEGTSHYVMADARRFGEEK